MGEEPQPSHCFDALVTHVDDTDKFCVQPLTNAEDRKKLHIIESALGNNPKALPASPVKDDYVSVKLNERGWKRARLQQDIHHIAFIQLIDYGGEEQVPESSLFTLPYEMGTDVLQEQSLTCALAGVKVSPTTRQPQASQYIKDILMNRKVTVKAYSISPKTNELLVDLATPDFPSVRQHVLLVQLGSPTVIPAAPHTKDPGTVQPKLGESNAVIVSHITDLTDFWIQFRATEKNINSMMTAMKSMYTTSVHSPANMINIGMLCCVQLGSDWFRAEIKQVLTTGYIVVILKDFGNVQLVTSKQIYPLEGSLISAPFWAVRCGLNNIAPTTPTPIGNFPKQLNNWFYKYATDPKAYLIAQFIRNADDRHWIELHDEQGGGEAKPTTTELLITNKCAQRITENFPAYTGMQAQLNQMGGEMATNLAQGTSQQQQQFSPMANTGMGGGTQTNGHGQSAMTSQAGYGTAHTSYPGAAPNSAYIASSTGYMNTMAQPQYQPTQSNPMAHYPAPAQMHLPAHQAVPLQTPVTMATQPAPGRLPRSRVEAKGPGDIFEGPYKKPVLEKMEDIAIEITRDPHDFICLLKKYFDDVDQANELLKTAYSGSKDYSIPSAKVKSGMACVAPFIDSGINQFYRAKVISISRNEADVFFVDYGNNAQVPLAELKYIPKSCALVPESSIRCEFDGVAPTDGNNSWNAGALRAFEDYLVGDFSCFIKGTNKEADTYKVELYADGDRELNQPISEELERRGVLVRTVDNMSATSNQGRRRGGQTASRESDKGRHQQRGQSPRSRDSEPERTHRGRDPRKPASPASSAANSELIRAGFRPINIGSKAFLDVQVYQPCTPSKFSCQILSEKESLDRLAKRMQQTYNNGGDEDFMDDVLPFNPCAVLVDTSWQRGYILSSSYHGCQVVLVDTQEILSVDQDQLRTLRSEFMSLPTQGVKCTLEGIASKSSKWTSESCRFFKEKVSESDSHMVAEFRGEKNGIHRILLMSSDLMVNAMLVHQGWATAMDPAVSDAADELASAKKDRVFEICDVKFGSSHAVVPSFVVGPNEFYLQLVAKREEIESLSDKISSYYNSPKATDKPTLSVDSYCAALWEEEWYRGKIVTVSRNEVEIYFLDYGNTDLIPTSDVKGLNKQFKQYPMYAIKCICEGIDPTMMESMNSLFKELVDIEDDEVANFHATFIKEQSKAWLVSLYEGNAPLVQKMYQKFYSGQSAAPSRSKVSSGSRVPSLPCLELPKKDLVMISHARDPMLLYLHCERNGETENNITEIQERLAQVYGASQPPLRIKQAGELCATQFSEDGCWYRGQIIAVHGDQVQVLFLDYGNEESKRSSEVYELERELCSIPIQTSQTQLANIAEPPNGWADAAKELNMLCEGMKFSLTVVDANTTPPTVELFDASSGTSLGLELIKHGYGIIKHGQCIAMPQLPSIDGGSFNVTIGYVTHPGRLYILKVSENSKLEELMEKLNEEYERLSETSSLPRLEAEPKIGTVCCAQYKDDEAFYRANIYGITRSAIKIQFADYGNVEDKNVSELYQLGDQYLPLPAQAIECSLSGCEVPSIQWTTPMQNFIEQLVENKTYNCQVVGTAPGAYAVTLHDSSTGNSLSEDVNRFVSSGGASAQGMNAAAATNSFGGSVPVAQPEAAPAPAKTDEAVKIDWPPRIDKFEHVPAMVSYGDGPEDFWVNLVDRDNKFDQLQNKIQEVYADGGRPVPRVFRYMYIAVKSPEFGEVYRAKTLNNNRDNPLVTYVDYGNEEEVPRDNMFILENYLATVLPCQAVRCALDGIDRLKQDGQIREELKTKFEELASDKEIMIKNISPAQREKPNNDVEIMINGELVVDLLEKELIALSGPPDVPVCTVKVGSVLKGAIVNITCGTEFWVQMAGNSAKINASTKVCTENMKEAPEVGTFCAVVLGGEDDTVYRAKVESLADGKVTVTCVDYGYHKTLAMKNVFKLKQSCGEEPAQAFPCSLPLEVLADCEEKVVEVLNRLSEKCVTVKLLSKTGDRFCVDFHPDDHVSLFVTPGHATSTLPALADVAGVYTFPTCDPQQTYYVSHINDLAEFYVQQSDLDITGLTTTVATACVGALPTVQNPTRGTPCVAKDATYQAWNRAIVTDILEDDMINLLYLDFGSSEKVKSGTVKELPQALKSLPVSAIKCSLSPLPEKHSDFTELFTTITADRELSVVPAEDGGMGVSIDGLPLTDVFTKATHYSTLKYSEPAVKETCNVYCTSVEDPFNIWVQLADYEEELKAVMTALSEHSPSSPALYTYTPGMVCAALFTDEVWYRAEITNQGTEKCTVKFVDYGNCCEVDRASLKLLPEEHLTLPVNCVLVRLGNVRPLTGKTWSDNAIDKLYELTEEVLCEMKCTSSRALQHVTLSVEGVDVATTMVGEAVALSIPDPAVLTIPQLSHQGGELSMFITHVEQVDLIYGQINENAEVIEAIGEVTEESLVSVDQLFKPLQCWAKWSDTLYRAILLDFSETHADVWFVDYGNKDKVLSTDIWYLNDEHVLVPSQAISLQLDGVKPVTGTDWSSAAKDALSTVVLEQSVLVHLPELVNSSVTSETRVVTSMVLEEGETDVAESLKSSKVARSLVQPPVITAYSDHVFTEDTPVYCIDVSIEPEGPVLITCQLAGGKVDEIHALLQETITVGHPDYTPERVEVGLPCTCIFTDDKTWYRSRVTDVQGDKVTVLFVDYGNSQVCKSSDIQLLPEQFSSPTQILTVSLANADKMSDVDRQFLSKIMIVDEELTMQHFGEEASFVIKRSNEAGEEIEIIDTVEATIAHSAAVGSYRPFPVLNPQDVVFTCQIDSAEEIYIQQDEEVLTAVEALMSAHTDKSKTPSPFVGQPVLAVFEDVLYRAVVLKVLDTKYKVRFVDYGNSSVVSEVYDVTPEEVATPPQAIRCSLDQTILAPGKSVTEVATFLNTLMTEKEVVVVVAEQTPKTVLEVVPVSFSVEGVNVRLGLLQEGLVTDPDESIGVYEQVTIPPKAVEVHVSHVENETLFFAYRTGSEVVEPDEDDDPLPSTDEEPVVDAEEYVINMQTVLEDEGATPAVLEDVAPGTICVTRWEGDLYRAVVVWVQHDFCKVRFIDYGNTLYCPLSMILDCPEPFRGPGLAVPFIGQLDGKPVTPETVYQIEKTDEGAVTVSLPPPKLSKYKYLKPELNTEFVGYVSYPLSHGQFFVQTDEGAELLETINPLIAAAVTAKMPVPNLVVDAPVVGLFGNDYYRGKVVEIVKEGVAKVLFVDYGNTETCSSMFNVTPELTAVRVIGINCQLENVNWVGVEAKPTLDEHVSEDVALTLTLTSYDKVKKQFTVKAMAGEGAVDLNAAVSAANVPNKAIPEPEDRNFPTNTFLKFYCSKINSVQDVCLQMEADSELLDVISSAATACTKIPLRTAHPGAVCLALDPTDNASYCRARVTSTTEDHYTVHFVDYGNRETLPLTSLFDIPVDLTKHKICGIQCKVANTVTPDNGFDTANQTTLQKLLDPNTELSVSILPDREDDCLLINVLVGALPLRDAIQGEALGEVPEKYGYGRFEGQQPLLISVVNDPADFYGQREEDSDCLTALFDLVTAKTDTETTLENPQIGNVCVALSPADECLYRSVVIKTDEVGVNVRYVDYGNTELVTSIYPVHPTLLSIPILAFPLSLHSINSPDELWSEESKAALSTHIYEDAPVTVTPRSWREDGKCEADVAVEGGGSLKALMVEHVENTDPEFDEKEARAAAAQKLEVEKEAPVQSPSFTYQKLDDTSEPFYVSHSQGPGEFYLQKAEWESCLEVLQAQIDSCDVTALANPATGAHCIALSLESPAKNRAEVLSTSSEGVLVRYVDYGNQELLPAENVYICPEILYTIPVYAVPCTLAGETWSQQARDTFLELVTLDSEVIISPLSWSSPPRLVCTCTLQCNGLDVGSNIGV